MRIHPRVRREVAPGVEIVGATWKSKKPVVIPLEELLDALPPSSGKTRIVLGHGIVDLYTPDKDAPGIISVATLERDLREGKADFTALGDRHSVTKLGASDRIWYSGTPVSTDFREDKSGFALVVELEKEKVATKEVPVGNWTFVEMEQIDLNHADDVFNLNRSLQGVQNKERTVVRLRLVGGLTLRLHAQLQKHRDAAGDRFAGFDVRDDDLVMLPEDADSAGLGFSGFADKTVGRLREQIEAGGRAGEEARDAEIWEAVKKSRSVLADTNSRLNDMLTALQTELLDRALGDALAGDVGVCEYSLTRAEQAGASKDLIQVFRGLAWMYGGRVIDHGHRPWLWLWLAPQSEAFT